MSEWQCGMPQLMLTCLSKGYIKDNNLPASNLTSQTLSYIPFSANWPLATTYPSLCELARCPASVQNFYPIIEVNLATFCVASDSSYDF